MREDAAELHRDVNARDLGYARDINARGNVPLFEARRARKWPLGSPVNGQVNGRQARL